MTTKEYITKPENIETIMSIFDNLLLNSKALKENNSDRLSRDELTSSIKHKLAYTFASLYPKKADHCRQEINECKLGFVYQIWGGKNSIKGYLDSLAFYQAVFAYVKQQGLYNGDFDHVENFLLDKFQNDKQTFNDILAGAKTIQLDYVYSENPQIEKNCKILNDYCMHFFEYLVEEKTGLDYDDVSLGEKLRIMDLLRTDEKMEEFKLRHDPIVAKNDPFTYDSTSDDYFKIQQYLKLFKESSLESGLTRYRNNNEPTYVLLGIKDNDSTIFHEFDHVCKGHGFEESFQALLDENEWVKLCYISFNEIMTEIDGEKASEQYPIVTGDEFLLKPFYAGNNLYRYTEAFVKKITNSDFFEVVKYAGFEGRESINILLSYSKNIKNLILNLKAIEDVSMSVIKEVESLGLISETLKSIDTRDVSDYLYRVGEKLASMNMNQTDFEVSQACYNLLYSVRNAYKAQEAVMQDVMSKLNANEGM